VSAWPFGSVEPWATRALTLASLATAIAAFAWDARRAGGLGSAIPLWPLAGLWLLALAQLLPLPPAVHRLVAPGPSAAWYPDVEEAAAVLGPGPFPISLHPEATRRWLAFATGILALALGAAPALRERRLLLRAAVAMVAGATTVAVYGLAARLVFGDKLYGIWSVPTVAPFGPFVSKNHFAGYVELAALLAVGLATGLAGEARRASDWLSWIESRRAKWVVLAWGAATVMVVAVLVSLSRGGALSLAAGLAFFLLVRLWARGRSRLSPRGVLAILGLATLASLAVVWLLPADARARVASLGAVTSEASGSYRLALWRDTLRLAASSPVAGSGFGAYEDAIRRFRTSHGEVRVEHAESDVLELGAEGGAVAALLVAAAAAALLLSGLAASLSEPQPLCRAMTSGALAGAVALGVHSLFDFNLHVPSNALLAGVLVAVLLAPARRRVSRPFVLVASTIGLVVALSTGWSPALIDNRALVRAGSGATASIRRAALGEQLVAQLRRRPSDASAWLALAWLRQPAARASAVPLEAWAVRLDPTNSGVRDLATRLGGSAN
jgi:O-antigen ligase